MRKLNGMMFAVLVCSCSLLAQEVQELPANDPIKLIEVLATGKTVTFPGPIKGYVKEAHLDKVLLLSQGRENIAGHVELTANSQLNVQGSTLENEGLYLILGFLRGSYPPGLSSLRMTDEEKRMVQAFIRGYALRGD